MSPVDVILMMENFDRRLSAVEQILPTLATKDDLTALREDLKAFATKEDLKLYPTRTEMDEKFEEAKRFALVLHEDLKSDIALIAEHVADLMTRVPRRGSS
jgi:hypothetical protein